MDIARQILLKASQSRWLATQASQRRFAQRAVLRFMPGEDVEAALQAGAKLGSQGVTTVFTQLGEDIADRSQAEAVTKHYHEVLAGIGAQSIRGHISVKLTQLGLDIDPSFCTEQVERIVRRAGELDNVVWIDIESSPSVDATLDTYRTIRANHRNVGLCLQAYLHRTPDDLESLLQIGARIRLVKGAYREPANLAIPKKADVDARYLELATRLLKDDARTGGTVHGMATHDLRLIRAIKDHARANGIPNEAYEFQMLYGIRTTEQLQLAAQGYRVRTLISYGSAWFPWYMRRLAERPANLWFVVKSVLA
jgi:proline dehydrogenase